MKFHDGSEVNADAIVWNVDKVLNKTAPQYAPGQIGNTLSRMPTLSGAEKIDRYTVALTTSEPDALLPYNITNLFIVSPTAWQKQYDAVADSIGDAAARSKQAWTAFAAQAVGSGPFKMAARCARPRPAQTGRRFPRCAPTDLPACGRRAL